MILRVWVSTAKHFSVLVAAANPPDSEILAAPQNAAGINLDWIRFITPILNLLMNRWLGDEDDIFEANQQIETLKAWMYEGLPMSIKTTAIYKALSASVTTSSLTYVDVADSQVLHTPSLSKMRVRVVLVGRNTLATSSMFMRMVLNGSPGDEANEAEITTDVFVSHDLSELFTVTPGVEVALKIQFRVDANTGRIAKSTKLVFDIIEYD